MHVHHCALVLKSVNRSCLWLLTECWCGSVCVTNKMLMCTNSAVSFWAAALVVFFIMQVVSNMVQHVLCQVQIAKKANHFVKAQRICLKSVTWCSLSSVLNSLRSRLNCQDMKDMFVDTMSTCFVFGSYCVRSEQPTEHIALLGHEGHFSVITKGTWFVPCQVWAACRVDCIVSTFVCGP